MDHGRNENKRRAPRNETETKEAPPSTQVAAASEEPEADDKPIPDDLSEISDDPDDILDRDDVIFLIMIFCNGLVLLYDDFLLFFINNLFFRWLTKIWTTAVKLNNLLKKIFQNQSVRKRNRLKYVNVLKYSVVEFKK